MLPAPSVQRHKEVADGAVYKSSFLDGGRIEVPTAAAIFKRELNKAPRAWAQAAYNLQRYTVFPRGGHFAALEEPELLVQDLREFFRSLR